MTNYLSPQQVLFIHARLLAEMGGEPGLFNLGLLESAVARPRATFDSVDLYPHLNDKAAALMESLTLNHPFMDGNKRVAIVAAALFLRRNGRGLTVDDAELERFTMTVARGEVSAGEIFAWFHSHSVTLL